MSIEGQVLGAATIAGGTGSAASTLANTGNPLVVGVVTAAIVLVALGIVTRLVARQN